MKKYRINPDLIIQKLEGKTVVFDGEKSLLYTFNETASYIFSQVKRGKTEEEIVEAMVKRYGIREERAKSDFSMIIREIANKKILVM